MDQPASKPNAEAESPPAKAPRLQRVLTSYRERDWVGISIELAVVVLGILIAFQIDQWGDQRERAREEREFLGRLYDEYQGGVAELNFVNGYHTKVRGDIDAAFKARNDPSQLETLRQTNDFGCGSARFRAAPFNDTAFEELLSSGRLNIISDQQLRGQIRDLATAQAAADRQVGYGRELVLSQLPNLNPYYRFDITSDGKTRCHIEWQEMFKDTQAVNTIVRAYRVHGLTLDERLKVRTQTQRLLRALACKLGKPECRR